MGKGVHGNFRNTVGRGVKCSVAENLPALTARFPLDSAGKFGEPGHGKARIIVSSGPIGTAYEFFNRITTGYDKIEAIRYKDGKKKGCVAHMVDGACITMRKKSTSDGSPAIDINISSPGRVASQKIHFVKEA